MDRALEVLQNIIENAIKYGDGHSIGLLFAEEEDCHLVTVKNSGCTLAASELPHIFDSLCTRWMGRFLQSWREIICVLLLCSVRRSKRLMYKEISQLCQQASSARI